MLSACQTVLAFCLLTLDEGMSPLSGREIEQVIKRREAQMAFIRKESASIGGVDACSDEDWTEANAWVSEHLPTGYHVAARAALEEALSPLTRVQVRRAMEVVAAVVYWDGAVTEGEESLFHDLARVAKLSDRATLEELERKGRRLARET
jgi:hypothetical protein